MLYVCLPAARVISECLADDLCNYCLWPSCVRSKYGVRAQNNVSRLNFSRHYLLSGQLDRQGAVIASI
jgi:hypothetical protein